MDALLGENGEFIREVGVSPLPVVHDRCKENNIM